MLRQSKSIYQKKKTVNKHTCTVIYLPLEESNRLPYVSTVSMYNTLTYIANIGKLLKSYLSYARYTDKKENTIFPHILGNSEGSGA